MYEVLLRPWPLVVVLSGFGILSGVLLYSRQIASTSSRHASRELAPPLPSPLPSPPPTMAKLSSSFTNPMADIPTSGDMVVTPPPPPLWYVEPKLRARRNKALGPSISMPAQPVAPQNTSRAQPLHLPQPQQHSQSQSNGVSKSTARTSSAPEAVAKGVPATDADRLLEDSMHEHSSSIALHNSPHARRWLDGCVNRSSVEDALSSSEYWRQRRFFLLYKHLYCVLAHYAANATSVLDVGSALPPFVNALGWISQRTIIGPKFAGNVAKYGGELFGLPRIQTKYKVSAIQADFLEWSPPGWPGEGDGKGEDEGEGESQTSSSGILLGGRVPRIGPWPRTTFVLLSSTPPVMLLTH